VSTIKRMSILCKEKADLTLSSTLHMLSGLFFTIVLVRNKTHNSHEQSRTVPHEQERREAIIEKTKAAYFENNAPAIPFSCLPVCHVECHSTCHSAGYSVCLLAADFRCSKYLYRLCRRAEV
jgi:hypothetical protein